MKHQNPNLVVDDSLLKFEKADPPKFLEGTGSLVIDHEARVAFVALSERAHEDVVHEHCKAEGLTPITFTSLDAKGRPIYHTNVMLSVCTSVAVVCAESIPDPEARRRVLDAPGFYGRIDVFALQCPNELVPVSLVEALACGRPAVVADSGAVAEFVGGDAATLVPHGDVDAVVTALDALEAREQREERLVPCCSCRRPSSNAPTFELALAPPPATQCDSPVSQSTFRCCTVCSPFAFFAGGASAAAGAALVLAAGALRLGAMARDASPTANIGKANGRQNLSPRPRPNNLPSVTIPLFCYYYLYQV